MAHKLAPLLIAGPTACGKSALALTLAEHFDGVIINADSMQVYDVLQVLTARPDKQDLKRVPHRLYGHIAPDAPYSVGHWQGEAHEEIIKARAEGKLPIVVGGTGLYFTRLTTGLVNVPEIADEIRAGLRRRLDAEGSEALHKELAEHDPLLAARLPVSDSQRILRGLEVVQATRRRLSQWQAEKSAAPLADWRGMVLMPDRQWLYARCNARFETMLRDGALAEVKALAALNLSPSQPVMKAFGVAELAAHLAGNCTLEEATARAQQGTRRYAKRQMTWYRNQMADWWMVSGKDYINNIDKIFSFVSK